LRGKSADANTKIYDDRRLVVSQRIARRIVSVINGFWTAINFEESFLADGFFHIVFIFALYTLIVGEEVRRNALNPYGST